MAATALIQVPHKGTDSPKPAVHVRSAVPTEEEKPGGTATPEPSTELPQTTADPSTASAQKLLRVFVEPKEPTK